MSEDMDSEMASSRSYGPPPQMSVEKQPARPLRLRYYTSLEEMRLVEVWRQHLHEIPAYNENLQIFRTIADGMNERGYKLNKQEVRRRISSYRNKYLAELNQMKKNPEYKSNWRLYPLVDCLFAQSALPDLDVYHQQTVFAQIERNIASELPFLQLYKPPSVLKTANFNRDPDDCPFFEPHLFPQPLDNKAKKLKLELRVDTASSPSSPPSLLFISSPIDNANKRYPLGPANRALPAAATPPPSRRRQRVSKLLPHVGQITMEEIQRLRNENQVLVEQREAQLADLKLKEDQFQQMEQMFHSWLDQQDTFLVYLKERESAVSQNCSH